MIGKKITLTGYGVLHTQTAQATVLRVTKLYAVLRFGGEGDTGSKFRLRDGQRAGEWQWSGYEIPRETLVKLREAAPKATKIPNSEELHHPSN